MAVTRHTLTGDFGDIVGDEFAVKSVKAFLTTNLPAGQALVNLADNEIQVGAKELTLDTSGAFSISLIASDSDDTNIDSGTLEYRVTFSYVNPATRTRDTWDSGLFALTANADLSDVAGTIEAPVAWRSAFITEMEAIQAAAEAARDAAVDISNISTPDALVKALLLNTAGAGPLTSAALAAATAQQVSTEIVDQETDIGAAFLAAVNSRLSDTLATDATRALVRKMRAGTDSANVTILGDSTANEAGEFFQLAMTALAAQFPTYTLLNQLWDDATQAYGAATTLQTGIGGARSLYCTLSNGAYMATPDAAAVSITGDLEVQMKVAVDDWTPATAIDLGGKSGAAPQVGWFVRLNTTGTLSLFWSADGTGVLNAASSAAVPFADGATGYVKVTLDVDNGASGRDVKFYTSTDGTTWTQLGTTQTSAGVTSIYDNTATLNFPGRAAAGPGGIGFGGVAAYWMRVYNGIGGTLVAHCDASLLMNSMAPFVDAAGRTWTPGSGSSLTSGDLRGAPILRLLNASAPGMAISYSNDSTRFAKQVFQATMDLAFINYGHNEGTATAYRTAYKQLADALLTKWPDCGIVAVVQNPQTTPRSDALIRAHASRGDTIRSLAASQRYALLDAYNAMTKAPGPMSTWVAAADGVHPTTAGSQLIATTAADLFHA